MARKFIGGVANVDIFVGDQLAITAKTLSDSSFTIGNTAEEVRGGQGNQLLAKYYHTSTFDIALTDVVFNLEYLAYQTGSTISVGADLFGVEQVTIATNKGQIAGVPLDVDSYGLIGWVSVVGEDTWQKVTFTENAGKYEFDYTAADGTIVCVKYVSKDVQGKSITISSNMIPSEVKLVMTANEFKAGKSNDISDSSKIGELQIVVPRFQFSGSMEISMTASGVANSPLEGSALAVEEATCGANSGYYAIVNEKIFGEDVFADVFALLVEGGDDISLKVGDTTTLSVYAVRKVGLPFIVDNSLCTFTSATPATATAGANTGLITGVAEGTTNVTVALTSKPTLEGIAVVTVTAA